MMNNWTEQTNLRNGVADFQKARKLGMDHFAFGKVGRSWSCGFLQKNGHCIVTKYGECFVVGKVDHIGKYTSNLRHNLQLCC